MPPLRLTLVHESEALAADRLTAQPDIGVPASEIAPRLAGRSGGRPIPAWAAGEGGAHLGGIGVYRTGPATVWPAFGAVADAAGRVFKASAGEALASGFTLADLARRRPAEQYEAAAVFLPYGGAHNFGHFLLDALPSLLALEETGRLAGRTALAPPLKAWQRDLLDLAFPHLDLHETAARAASAHDVAWADSMDHYLHRPSPILTRLRERILARTPTTRSGRRIYVSRRGWSMRVLVNEAELERALLGRGFDVVRPETLAAADQVRLFRDAEIAVGATGAAMAGALFAAPGARIVELLPQTYAHPWVRDLCLTVGADWRGWFEPAPLPTREIPWRYRLRRGFRFGWRLDVQAFLAWLDAQ